MSTVIMCKCMPANSAYYLCCSVLAYKVFTKSDWKNMTDKCMKCFCMHPINLAFIGGPGTLLVEGGQGTVGWKAAIFKIYTPMCVAPLAVRYL